MTYRIYVSRDRGLRCLPRDFEDIEAAKTIFVKHHGDVSWCLIGQVDPYTERPTFLVHGAISADGVQWKALGGSVPGH